MVKKEILTTKGDKSDTIDNLIDFLNKAKKEGATHYKMRWSQDPNWDFKWFETYKIKSEQEIKQEKIKELEEQIKQLKE